MAKIDDICECGHSRKMHNNRILGNYHSEMKYNCCMDWDEKNTCMCSCVKFKKAIVTNPQMNQKKKIK